MRHISSIVLSSIFIFSFFVVSSQTYIITNVAGLRSAGYSGDGGLATNAHLYNPMGVCVDKMGNIYIGDWANSRLRMVNTSSIITTIAGIGTFGFSGDGGPASSAELNGPMGVFADDSGDIFVSDIGNARIRKIKAGIISTFAGNGIYGFSGDGGLAINAELADPTGLCSDADGNIYVADVFNNRIRKIDNSGIINTVAGISIFGFSGDGGAATNAELYYPSGVAADNAGNIYIADEDNNRVRMVNSNGIISTVAGNGISGFSGDGGPGYMSEIYDDAGVAVDKSGNVYIADGFNNRIRMLNTNGIISTIAGNGIAGYSGVGETATLASLYNPVTIECDTSGNIYFANAFNNFVQKLTKVSAENPAFPSFTVFPNPNYGEFTVYTGNFTETLKFQVYDILGQLVSVIELSPGLTKISLNKKSSGIYFYRVMDNDSKSLATGKLIIL